MVNMLNSDGCIDSISNHHLVSHTANYVSPLQKATDPNHTSDFSPLLEYCYDVLVSAADPDLCLSLPIDGGSDAGMFCIIGGQLDSSRLVYHQLDGVRNSQRSLTSGDIILAFNQYEISGYTRRDAIDLCDCLTRVNHLTATAPRPHIRIKLIPSHKISTGNTMLSSFLAAAFSVDSPEYALQERIRENVYQRVVPCTTRLPRADEVDGIHYRFMSVPQFLALEKSGQLLESGMYKGNHYGTPRPEPNATALESAILNHLSLSNSGVSHTSDDSCTIPPPLPPLASLSNAVGFHLGQQSSRTSPPIQHPPPPRPPVRQSSINNQANDGDGPSIKLDREQKAGTSPSSKGLSAAEKKSYHLDCDLTPETFRQLDAKGSDFSVVRASETTGGPVANPVPDKPLPYGWELIRDPDYGTFYIDHIRERTQYEPPNAEDYAMAAALQAQVHLRMNGTPNDSLGRTTAIDQRVTPTLFSTDKDELRGPIKTINLQKGPNGFGFTIIGGSDGEHQAFLQIKHIIPGGPASSSKCLAAGDVLVGVNASSVLGYTHTQLVELFQSIAVGSVVQLTVSQGYRLPRDRPESGISDTSLTPPHTDSKQLDSMSPELRPGYRNSPATRDSSVLSSSSQTSNTASPPPITTGIQISHGEYTAPEDNPVPLLVPTRARNSHRPEFLKVSILKQPNGFGFTLADHPQGQHVKAILDPARCGRLQVGDVLVEINDQRVKESTHLEVVHLLKQCAVGQEARLLVQRGGLYLTSWPVTSIADPNRRTDTISVQPEKVLMNGFSTATDSTDLHVRPHARAVSGGLVDLSRPPPACPLAIRPDSPNNQCSYGVDYQQRSHIAANSTKHPIQSTDRRRRTQPMDDSMLDCPKECGFGEASQYANQYGSLVRPGRTRPNLDNQSGVRAPFLMLPGEFMVHLRRQSSGFGFNVVGGAEENSQVVIGSLAPGGAAQLSGVVHSGDRLVSINGVRVLGAKHRDVVKLLEQAAYSVGQVTLGLQRPPEFKQRAPFVGTRDTVEVVVPRSQKGDGFGFFISNTHPSVLGNNVIHPKAEGEFIAQLVPNSKAEQLGLLSVGDRILAVNKVPINGLHHEQVVKLIRESGSHIVLDIIPSAASNWASVRRSHASAPGSVPMEFPVTLFRGSRGFGFSIRGGHEFDNVPLLVLRIVEGGAAQMDGRLKVGDELIEINGHSTIGMSHGRAIEIIQAGGNTMRLTVRRNALPPNVTDQPTSIPHFRHTTRSKPDQSALYMKHNLASARNKHNRYSVPRTNGSCAVMFNRSQMNQRMLAERRL